MCTIYCQLYKFSNELNTIWKYLHEKQANIFLSAIFDSCFVGKYIDVLQIIVASWIEQSSTKKILLFSFFGLAIK